MSTDNPDDLENVDQQIRINELRHEAEDAVGGQMVTWESPDAPPEIMEQFWKNVVEFEKRPRLDPAERLAKWGIDFPPADSLDYAQLHEKLFHIIRTMAGRSVYFSSTNHLSDRELYEYLAAELVHEVTADAPPGSGWVNHIDLLGSGSKEHMLLYHKYYADEDQRQRWLKEFPNYKMPAHVDPPHDRDRLLPQPPPPPEWVEPEGFEDGDEEA